MASPSTDRRLGLLGGTAYKAPVTVVATSNVMLSGEQTIDGISCLESNAAGKPDRVLCIAQSDATQNGIWDVSTSAWTRSKDANGNYDLTSGTQVYVARGTQATTIYSLTTTDPITIGTTALTWATASTLLASFMPVWFYGAVGDGVTDDTVALQRALDSALALDFGDHTKNYRVTGTLATRDYAFLRGAGARLFQDTLQTPIFDCANKTDNTITGLTFTGKAMSTATAGNFVIGRKYSIISVGTTDFTLIGAASNTPGQYFTATGVGTGTGTASTFYNRPAGVNQGDVAIKGDYATNLTVAFCTFNDFAYSALMVAFWGTNIKFLHNVVDGPGAYNALSTLTPLYPTDPQTPGFRNCTGCTILGYGIEVHGNQIQNTSQGLIIGQQSRDITISDNVILNTAVEHGMYVDAGCKHVSITGNKVTSTKLNGIKVQWYDTVTDVPFNIVIANNSVDAAGGDGIVVLNASQNVVATLTGVTQAAPGVFTTLADHGLSVGNFIDISGVTGMTPVNSSFKVASVPTTKTFTVRTPSGAVDTSGFPAYVSGGTVTKPIYAKGVVITGNTVNSMGQDGISVRYIDGGAISGNTVQTTTRIGVYALIALNIDISGNFIRDTQNNGVHVYSPIDQCSIFDNTLSNVGAAGDDTGGASSGIFIEGDGGGTVEGNVIHGEITQTKMFYGIQLGSGDKRQWAIQDNQIYDAESAIVALHNLDSYPPRLFGGNIGTAASGPDALTGLSTALPSRGNPRPDWWGNSAPTTLFWAQGSRVWKILPAAGDPMGWVCTASGTPGTWQPLGVVHNVAATQALAGTYTPTVTAVSNLDGVTARLCNYFVYGNVCTVFGRVGMDQTATPTVTNLKMTLPIASNLGASSFATLAGTYASFAEPQTGGIYNDGLDNLAHFKGNAATTVNIDVAFQFSYVIA